MTTTTSSRTVVSTTAMLSCMVTLLMVAPDARAQLKLPDLAQVDGAQQPGSAQAMPQAVVVQPRPVRFLIGVGVTGGGAKLAEFRTDNGWYRYETQDIRAGQLLQISAGLEWRVAPAVTMQGTIGYHYDSGDAWNGSVDFIRYPLELLAHYEFAPRWRAGGGLRYTLNPRIEADGAASSLDMRFKRSLGPVIEVEYLPLKWLGIKLRAGFERYKPRDGGRSLNGNHIGGFATFYF